MEFLVRGATEFDEPGVFMAFEETAAELTKNVRSLGFDLDRLVADEKLRLDYVRVERSEIEETGEYDLEGLFVRLGYAIDAIGAKRVVLDTIESLFVGVHQRRHPPRRTAAAVPLAQGQGRHRHHHRRARRGDSLTRQGLEEYVSDCVILLDHRVHRADLHPPPAGGQVPRHAPTAPTSTRSSSTNGASRCCRSRRWGWSTRRRDERVSTGIERLDAMLGGEGIYRGSTS